MDKIYEDFSPNGVNDPKKLNDQSDLRFFVLKQGLFITYKHTLS